VTKLSGFQRYVGEWNVKTFPDSTFKGHIHHIKKEVEELEEAYLSSNDYHVAQETADVFIMLLSLAHRLEFDLMDEAANKMRILLRRKWQEPDENGVIEHVR